MDEKILIVGGGLSGTIFAWQLYFNNIDFVLINQEREYTSSKIAAGIYNPIVFKRFICSWQADLLIPYLDEFYTKIEEELKGKFHYKIDIYKCFTNNDEINLWKKKSADFPNLLYMDNNIIESNSDKNLLSIKNTIGFGVVKNSGYIETKDFLELSHKFFSVKNILRNYKEKYNYINYNEENSFLEFSKIIFAEGYYGEENPFFPDLRYNFAKGELLEVEIEDFDVNFIISKNLFIFPKGNNRFLIGSTFDWTFEDENPTEIKKNELIMSLEKIINKKYRIIEQRAGIRPATFDRRPFIGNSELNPNCYIFNGMGAKAVLLAPYCSSILFNNIFNGKDIPSEINVKRGKKK